MNAPRIHGGMPAAASLSIAMINFERMVAFKRHGLVDAGEEIEIAVILLLQPCAPATVRQILQVGAAHRRGFP